MAARTLSDRFSEFIHFEYGDGNGRLNLLEEAIKRVDEPHYAQNNSHYYVRPDGSWGARPPLSMGPRDSYESRGGMPALTYDPKYVFWPEDGFVYVRSREAAIELVTIMVLHNARIAVRVLEIMS